MEAVTAILPNGWQDRLARFETAGAPGAVARFLESHDLWISKGIARKPKDLELGRVLLAMGIVEPAELIKRLRAVDAQEAVRKRISSKIGAWSTM